MGINYLKNGSSLTSTTFTDKYWEEWEKIMTVTRIEIFLCLFVDCIYCNHTEDIVTSICSMYLMLYTFMYCDNYG